MKRILSLILSLCIAVSAVTALTIIPAVAETSSSETENGNLFPDAGFENATLGATDHEIFKDRVFYSTARKATLEVVANTDNTAVFGNKSLKYYSVSSAAGSAASQYDLMIPVQIEKNKKYLFRFYYKNTTANRVGFTIAKENAWEGQATIDYSFYTGTYGTKSTNTWSFGYEAGGKLKNGNAAIKTHAAAFTHTGWNEMQVIFDSLENEGTVYLVIGMLHSTSYDHTVYLDNLQFSELEEVTANGSFVVDGGYYTVSGSDTSGETFRFTTGAAGSPIVYDDTYYALKGESAISYSATPTYGNGFLGWYSGDTLVSSEQNFSSSLSLKPKFDKKNLISYGDFEDAFLHENITNEISGYTLKYGSPYNGTPAIAETAGMLNTDASHGDYALALTPHSTSTASKQKGLVNIPVTLEKNTDYIWRFSYKFDDSIANENFNTSNKHFIYMAVDGLVNGKIPWSNSSSTVKYTMHSQNAGVAVDSTAFKNGWSWGGSATGLTLHAITDNGTGRKGYWQDVYFLFNPKEDPAIFTDGSSTGTAYLTLGTVNDLTDTVYIDNISLTKAVNNATWTQLESNAGGSVSAARLGESFYWYTPTARSATQSFTDLDKNNTYVPDMYLPFVAKADTDADFICWKTGDKKYSEDEKINVPTISDKTYYAEFFNKKAPKEGYGHADIFRTEKGGKTVYNYKAKPYYGNTFVGWYDEDGNFITDNPTYSSVEHSNLKAVFDGGNTIPNGDLEYNDDISFIYSDKDRFSVEAYSKDVGNGKYYLSFKNTTQETIQNAIVMPVKKNTDYTISFDMKINEFGANGWFRAGISYQMGNWSAVAALGNATETFLNPETGYTVVYESDDNGRLQPGGGLDARNVIEYFDGDWIHFTTIFNSGEDENVFGDADTGTLYLMLYNFNNGMDIMFDNIVFGTETEVMAHVKGNGTASADKTLALPGDSVTFTATAGYGSAFDGWYSGNRRVSQESVFTTNEYLSLIAHFKNYASVSDAGFEKGTTGDFVGRFEGVTFENISHTTAVDAEFGKKLLKVTATNNDYLTFYVPAKVEANTKYLIHFSYKVEAATNTRTDIMVGPKNSWSSFTDSMFYASSSIYSYSKANSYGQYPSDNLTKHFGDGFIEMNVIVNTADELVDDSLYILFGAKDGATFYIDNVSVTKISDITPYMIGATLTTETSDYYKEGTLSYASGLNYISPATVLKEIGTVTIPTQLIPAGTALTKDVAKVSIAKLSSASGLNFDAKQFYATFRGTDSFNPGVKLSARSYGILTDKHGRFEWTFYSENNNEGSSIVNGVYNRSITQIRRLLALSLINTFEGYYPEDFWSDDDVSETDNVKSSASVSSDEAWNFVKRNAYLYGVPELTRPVNEEDNLFINGDFEDTTGYLGAIRQNLVESDNDGLSFSGGNSGNAVWYDYDHDGWIYYSGTNYQFSYGTDHSSFFNYADSSVTAPHSGNYSLRLNTRAGTASYILEDLEPQTDYELSFYWKGTDTLGINYTYVYPYIHEFFGFETQTEVDTNDRDNDGNTTESLPIIETINGVDYRLNKLIDQRYFSPDTLSLYSEAIAFDSDFTYGNRDWIKKTLKFNTQNNTSVVFGVNFASKVNSGNIYIDDFVVVKSETAKKSISNGSFENGIDNWNGYASTYKVGGQPTASFNGRGQSLWQTVKVDRNTDYTLTVRAKTREEGALHFGITNSASKALTALTALSNTSHVITDSTGTATYTVDFHAGEYEHINVHLSSLCDSKVNIFSVELTETEKSIVYDRTGFEDAVEYINGGTSPLANIAKTNNLWYALTTDDAHSGSVSLLMKATANDTNANTDFTTDDGELLKHPLYQKWSTFPVISGNYYKLSYYVKAKTAGTSYESSIRYLHQHDWDYLQAADKKTVTLNDTNWTYVEHIFCIDFPVKMQYLADFVVSANDGTTSDLYFDDIVFEETTPLVESGTPEKLYTESIFNLIPDNDLEEGGSVYTEGGATILTSGAYNGQKALRVNAGTRIVLPIKTYVDYNYIPSVIYTFSAAVRKSSGGAGYVGISYTADGNSFYTGGTNGSKIVPASTGWEFTGFSYHRETVTPTYLVIECTSGYIDVDMMSLFTHQHAFKDNPNVEKEGYDYDDLSGAVANGGTSVSGAVSLSVNNKTPITTLYTGLDKTVYQAFVDECMGREFTEKQLDFEINMLKEAGITLVRTMFRTDWVFTGDENDPWDWDNDEMQQFYKWCRKLAENDIEVAIIPCASLPGFVYGSSSGPDVSYMYPKELDANGEIQYTLSWGVLHPAIDFSLACERYAEFFTQTIEAMYNHGITNVTHALTFNEPCHPNGTLYKGAHAELMLQLVEKCVDKMKSRVLPNGQTVRDYITLVGPNQANRTNAGLADFFLENGKYGIDLYDIWTTHMVTGVAGDIVGTDGDNYDEAYARYTAMMNNFLNSAPFLCDEFAVQGYKWEYDKNSNDNEARWWGVNYAGQYAALVNSGMSGGILWQLIDNNWTYLAGSGGEFMYGIHMTGAAHSALQTQTPYYSYYTVTLLTKYLSTEQNGSSYVGTSNNNHVHTTAIKKPDGNWSILVVNNNETAQNIKVNLTSSLGGKTMYRHVYEAATIEPESSARILDADKTFTNVTTTINDTIPAGSVVVYTTIKG